MFRLHAFAKFFIYTVTVRVHAASRAETTVQDPPGHTGYFVVTDGPRAGIFPDPVTAAGAAAGTTSGMHYAASKEDAERILRAATATPPVLASQSADCSG